MSWVGHLTMRPTPSLRAGFSDLFYLSGVDHDGCIQTGPKALVRQLTFPSPQMPLIRFPAAWPIAGLVRIFYSTNAFDTDGKGFL